MRQVPLKRRDGSIRAYALVDDEDFAAVSRWSWHLSKRGYPERSTKRRGRHVKVKMHRFLLGLTDPSSEGEHISLNKLDNRRCNLRVATRAENGQNLPLAANNTSGHRGVSWSKKSQKWYAYANVRGRMHGLGLYSDRDEAARVASAFRAKHMPFSSDARAA